VIDKLDKYRDQPWHKWVKTAYALCMIVLSPVVIPLTLVWVYREEVVDYYKRAWQMLVE
jgi:hypothetical protein